MIRYILLFINILVFTFIFSILIIFVGIFDSNKNYTGFLSRLWAQLILKFSFINYKIKNLEKIKNHNNNQYVIISNHQSFLDILVTFASFPFPIAFFTKKELFYIPIFGWAMKFAGMIYVDRNNKKKSKESVNIAMKKIDNTNLSILNYPEGTRVKIGSLGKFKKGGFILSINSKLPIIPLIVKYKSSNKINNHIRLVVGDVIDTLNYTLSDRDILIDRVRKEIQSNL